jgi:hypothetical protein
MRINQFTCPKCGAGMKSKAGVPVGQTIPCPKCGHKFTATEPDEPELIDDVVEEIEVVDDSEVEESPPARKKGPPPPPKKRSPSRDADDDAPSRSARKKPSRRRDDADDDEDDEEPPRKRRRGRPADDDVPDNLYWRLRRNIAVRVITLVILLGILAVLAYLLYEKNKAEREDVSRPGEVGVAIVCNQGAAVECSKVLRPGVDHPKSSSRLNSSSVSNWQPTS